MELALVDGIARASNISCHLPIPIARLCARFQSEAFFWTVSKSELDYLLSSHAAEMSNHIIRIGDFHFHLRLRNDQNRILFECVPLRCASQCRDPIYCELYCVETRSQHKGTFLFNTALLSNPKRRKNPRLHRDTYPPLLWSSEHLSVDECRHRPRLTFAFYANILSRRSCQRPFPAQIHYRWHFAPNANANSLSAANYRLKMYSPNFAEASWCLWRRCDLIGLQLLKLPVHRAQGVMFECRLEWDGCCTATEFTYFLDSIHSDVEIRSIPSQAKWISVTIRCK